MSDERLTEDLLKRLLESATLEDYLEQEDPVDRQLVDYLAELLADRGIKRSQVVQESGVNGTVVYDVFSGKCKPGRGNAIMLAFGLRCSLRETQRLLRLAGVSELWPKVRRDAIIIWCIDHKMNREKCDDELWQLGEKTLLRTGGLR
ncbi:MAG: XRE family transcriptional regulator [Eggerthellaceae bacterium]|nr:XRE family transcriptional regulator [Eggerthellaceae bacterium]